MDNLRFSQQPQHRSQANQHYARDHNNQAPSRIRQPVSNQPPGLGFVTNLPLELTLLIGPPPDRLEQSRDADVFLDPLLGSGDAEQGLTYGMRAVSRVLGAELLVGGYSRLGGYPFSLSLSTRRHNHGGEEKEEEHQSHGT